MDEEVSQGLKLVKTFNNKLLENAIEKAFEQHELNTWTSAKIYGIPVNQQFEIKRTNPPKFFRRIICYILFTVCIPSKFNDFLMVCAVRLDKFRRICFMFSSSWLKIGLL